MRLTLIFFAILISTTLRAQLLQIDFDRPDSGNLKDNSRYAHPVNHFGKLRYVADRFGNGCRAAEFTGSQFLEIPTEEFFDIDQEFTAMAWLKLPVGKDLQWITLICKGLQSHESSRSPAFRVQMTSRTVSVNTSSTKEIDEITQSFPAGQWFHFATTFDNGKITLYINGKEYKVYYTSTYLQNNNHSVTIGYDVPGDEEYFEGVMDDLYFFDQVLKPKEIARYANDKSGQNLGGICPTDPSSDKPVITASNDPWQNVSIDEVDDQPSDPVEKPGNAPGTRPDPVSVPAGDQPDKPLTWDNIPIDDLSHDTPEITDPVAQTPPVDPWSAIDIEEFSPDDPDLQNDLPLPPAPEEDVPVTSIRYPLFTLKPKTFTGPLVRLALIPGKVPMIRRDVPDTDFHIPFDPETDSETPEQPVAGGPAVPPVAEEPGVQVTSEPVLVTDMDSLTVGRKMILDKIEFARHKHHLNDRSKNVLKKLARMLKKNPDYNILLEGHTEIDGNREANLALSQRRADACKKYLIKKWKIKPRRIETKFYGPDRPITRKKSVLWKNRRVEVTVF